MVFPQGFFAVLRAAFSAGHHRDALNPWGEAIAHLETGLMGPPRRLHGGMGRYSSAPQTAISPRLRFAAYQSDMARPIGDLKESSASRFCQIVTPISLRPSDNAASLAQLASDSRSPVAFGKYDCERPYKYLPIRPIDIKFRSAVVRNPKEGC